MAGRGLAVVGRRGAEVRFLALAHWPYGEPSEEPREVFFVDGRENIPLALRFEVKLAEQIVCPEDRYRGVDLDVRCAPVELGAGRFQP
jgi:hypothetical protein